LCTFRVRYMALSLISHINIKLLHCWVYKQVCGFGNVCKPFEVWREKLDRIPYNFRLSGVGSIEQQASGLVEASNVCQTACQGDPLCRCWSMVRGPLTFVCFMVVTFIGSLYTYIHMHILCMTIPLPDLLITEYSPLRIKHINAKLYLYLLCLKPKNFFKVLAQVKMYLKNALAK
jgi:hypothetical protein